ncbi:lycopene beta-cyclase CrtY [Sphingomonas sp. HMP6]|uniref:lycopene beta-cyclase CrtY n=1 Tax=Sphingomonas sp. HMP6 TaxID=1517551 RepID=UPI0015971308|nr:lycopene beta-cyclase CrtY [Sphingomonas sp. HMP6]BCA59807.1 lycopene cyclase [Sphingomonas sp. HMP6]
MPTIHKCDLAIVGGGLAGGLIALALAKKRPGIDVRIVEGADTIGGNHLWSFFASDIDEGNRWIVAPLISYGWTQYDIAFPAHKRTLKSPYYSIESERLDTVIRAALPEKALMTGRKVLAASPTAVVLADGDRIEAKGVIDARGPGDLGLLDLGWQKFVGMEFALDEPHGVDHPIVMDATVEQIDGYRFVYTLPFSATRLFVEDTYYSDTPDLYRPKPGVDRVGGSNADPIAERVLEYAAAHGWQTQHIVREESGVLPVTMGGDFEAYWQSGGNKVAKAGMRAGLFHPTTGYSLPDAVRMAALVATASDLSGAGLHSLTHDFARRTWKARGFYRMLDKMLFRAADPQERYRVLERFYRLDPQLVRRFYAGRSTLFDKMRVLSGKPPVPIPRAMRAIGLLPTAKKS